MKNGWGEKCGVFILEMVVAGPIGRRLTRLGGAGGCTTGSGRGEVVRMSAVRVGSLYYTRGLSAFRTQTPGIYPK